ncbi:hypothetical protein HXX76_014107 [Chlamydomonas incerta]|uniref:Uncharacterized protein n=1 Tax=Chlamydomonas incerta TaxID=51695 RepID=A0A835VTH8_CHLIN|nr:hypothetical protein HXX76_014107 [Chlamydomonas incerta]|eukprot:KAG2424949.1 hypothetical protein HXX76_014107 [Chlamydomonas incerta]
MEQEEAVAHLTEKVASQEGEIAVLQKEVQTMLSALGETQSLATCAESDLKSLQCMLQAEQRKMALLEETVTKLKKERAWLTTQLDATRHAISLSVRQNLLMGAEINGLRDSMGEIRRLAAAPPPKKNMSTPPHESLGAEREEETSSMDTSVQSSGSSGSTDEDASYHSSDDENTVKVHPRYLGRNLHEHLKREVKYRFEDKCTIHGYISPGSIQDLRMGAMVVEASTLRGYVNVQVEFSASAWNPLEKSVVMAQIKTSNPFGLLAVVEVGGREVMHVIVPKNIATLRSTKDLATVHVGSRIEIVIVRRKMNQLSNVLSAIGLIKSDARHIAEEPEPSVAGGDDNLLDDGQFSIFSDDVAHDLEAGAESADEDAAHEELSDEEGIEVEEESEAEQEAEAEAAGDEEEESEAEIEVEDEEDIEVAAFIQSLDGASLTKNKNGYFVDLCTLSDTQVAAVSETIRVLLASDQGVPPSIAEGPGVGAITGEQQDPVDLTGGNEGVDATEPTPPAVTEEVKPPGCLGATSSVVMRHIDDIIKKHIPPQPTEPAKKKGLGTYKRTMVVTSRKLDGYEARLNDLREEDVLNDQWGATSAD